MAEDQNKFWYELGNTMGLVVSLEEEEQQTEEDKEVERILSEGKRDEEENINGYVDHVKWIHNISTVPVIILNQINVEHVELNVFWVNIVCSREKSGSGHSMISEGHKTVAEGWRMFEEAVDESMPGDLPQLLRTVERKIYANTTPITHGTLAKLVNRANQFQQHHCQ